MLRLHNISTSTAIPTAKPITDTYYSTRFATYRTHHWVYYNTVDSKYGIPMHIYRRCIIGCAKAEGELVISQSDPTLTANLEATVDGEYLFATVGARPIC